MVDDQPRTRRLVYHALKRRYRVLEAVDADAAIATVEREPVDLVLLDLHLPPHADSPREGMRAHRRIAELRGDLPVVVVSGNGDPAVRNELLRRGARGFLPKPVDVDELERVIRALLGGRGDA